MNKYFELLGIIGLSSILLFLLFYFCYFLRLPKRKVPDNRKVFVSPANGKIIAVITNPTKDTALYKKNIKVLDNFVAGIGEDATMVSIMMTPLNVHYQRAPSTATLIEQIHSSGKKKNAMRKAKKLIATLQNEYNAMLFERNDGIRFKVIQIAGFVAKRIVSYLKKGDIVNQGEVIGLIKFGSQVSIIFDKRTRVLVKVGDKVIDGETVVAEMKEM